MSPVVKIKTLNFLVDPVSILAAVRHLPYPFLLDSSLVHPQKGRYSFIGAEPFFVFRSKGKDPLPDLRSNYLKFRRWGERSQLPFNGGMVGYLAYDAGFYLEKIRTRSKDDLLLPDSCFGFYNSVIVVDHVRHKTFLVAEGHDRRWNTNRLKNLEGWVEDARSLERSWGGPLGRGSVRGHAAGTSIPAKGRPFPWQSNFTSRTFQAAVRKAKEHIRRGDIYQVNLAQRFSLDLQKYGRDIDPLEIYRVLRSLSPSSFGGFMDFGDFQLISSSPERFLKLSRGIVETSPMKGTRPRGNSRSDDRYLRQELQNNAKEKAELLMITDLERNDLGRVCEFGSVGVRALRSVEAYRTVYQATATVQGHLRKGKDGFDLLRACFPGGSVTGCPKIRAMEVIEEIEDVRRGPYTGAFGYLDFGGDLDLNILIRTLILKGKKIYFHAGSGIVADSSPRREYEETLTKTLAIKQTLKVLVAPNPEPVGGRILFLDGKMVPVVRALEESLTPGNSIVEGIFETMLARRGAIQFLGLHLARLKRGLRILNMTLPCSDKELRLHLGAVLRKNKLPDARVRLSVWRSSSRIHWAITAKEHQPIPRSKYAQGVKAKMMSFKLNLSAQRPYLKSLDYRAYRKAYEAAARLGFDEALLVGKQGVLMEGSRTNLFFFEGGNLCTPALASGCLRGVTRQIVIGLARLRGWKVKEVCVGATRVLNTQEAFLTNALMGVMPLTKINGRRISQGRPGPLTRILMQDYARAAGR